MRNAIYAFAFFAAFAIISPTAHAWYNDTHAVMTWKVCNDYNCPLPYKEVFKWSNYPDTDLKDNENHLCVYKDCPAKIQYDLRLLKAENSKTEKEKWQEIAIGSHYYFDSKNVMHQVPQNSKDIQTCHREFEAKVNDLIIEKKVNWTVEVCEVQITDFMLNDYVLEFETYIEDQLDVKKSKNSKLIECNFWCKIKKKIVAIFSR